MVPHYAAEVAVGLDVRHLLLDLPVGVPLGVVWVEDYLTSEDILRDALLDVLGLPLRLGGCCGLTVCYALSVHALE